MQIEIKTLDGGSAGSAELPDELFAAQPRKDIIARVVHCSSPDYPGERLVACRNPELARLRAHTRDDLLLATEQSLQKIKVRVCTSRRRRWPWCACALHRA